MGDDVITFPSREKADNPFPVQRVTKENLTEYLEDQSVNHASHVVPELFLSVQRRLKKDDAKAADQAMQLYGFSKTAPMAVITNLTQNNYESGQRSATYFENIVRQLESRDRPEGGQIIEAEVVEEEQ